MHDTAPLTGRAALITAGGGGIGRACAEHLARDGAVVTLMGRTEETLVDATAQVRAALAGEGAGEAELHHVVGDATVPDDVARAVEVASEPTGGLQICVAGVGGSSKVAPLLALDEETFADDLRRNVVSAFTLIKRATPAMVDAGGGSIVCISSEVATMAWPYLAAYCAGKAGMEALVRVAAEELGPVGVRVNAVRPGLTRTGSRNVERIFSDPDLLDRFVRERPLGRPGEPGDIAAGVRYLAGPESAWVTGQCLGIDGGCELRKAPSMEAVARARLGDEAVEAALAGHLPER